MNKAKHLYDAITSADAWYIAGSPLLDSISGTDEPNGNPENEVLNFIWIGDEDGTEFSESITEEDLNNATVNSNTITIHDLDGNFDLVLYKLVSHEIDITPDAAGTDNWFIQICEMAGIRLVQAQEEEIAGRWDWLDDNGNACDMSFSTEEAAAEDAVKVLFPTDDWRHDVQNGDTKLSFIEWVEHNAESMGTQHAKAQVVNLN